MQLQKNVLHYYVDLLRMHGGEIRNQKNADSYIAALNNIIHTMRKSRHDTICGEDFTSLDWGTIPFNNIDYSHNGKMPCNFSHSLINRWNFIYGHQDRIKNFFYIPNIDKILTYSNKEMIFWNLNTDLPSLIIYANEFETECDITVVYVIPEENVYIVGTDTGNLYIRSLYELKRNLLVQTVENEIISLNYSPETGKLLVICRKRYKTKEIIKIHCWSVNQFRVLRYVWKKTIFDGRGDCDVKFATEIIAVSYYYYDNRKTITQVIEVNTGSIIDSFTDDFSYFQSFLSINGEIIALQLSDSNSVSVHYIDSPQQSFVVEDAELLYTDSSPFSYNSKALFIIRDNQVLFHDLKSHKESLAFSLPSNNPNDPRDRGWHFSMSLNQKYCLIWDGEAEFYLISVASGVISKIDLQQSYLVQYIKYCPELNQFLLAGDHVLVTIDPDNINYRILDISNSDSTHRLITTDHTCIFMFINDESMETDLQVGKVVHEYMRYDYSLIARSNNGLEIRSSYHHDYSLEDWVVYTTTLVNGMSEISLDFHKDECTVACFSMDSKSGLSASRDAIAIWDSEQGRIIEWHLLNLCEDESIISLAISPDNKYVGYITTSEEYDEQLSSQTIVSVFDRANLQPMHELHLDNLDDSSTPVARLTFCGNNKICIIACDDGRIIIWNYDDNIILYDKTIIFPEEYQYCMDLAISLDGRYIVYDMDNRSACVVDVSTIISETSYSYKPIYYLPKIHISNCSFKDCVIDDTTRKILYQYGAEI